MLDEKYLEQIAARLNAATPGPWRSFVEARDEISGSDFIQTAGEDIYLSGATVADQDFIAHARLDVDILLNEIRRLYASRII